MNIAEMKQLCEAALAKWGKNVEIQKTIEEMKELKTALLAYQKKHESEDSQGARHLLENVREEIADVSIMLMQLRVMYDDRFEQAIDRIIESKYERLKKRIENHKGASP